MDTFPEDVAELRRLFEPASPNQRVRAVPGAGLQVPLWLLGSSLYGAHLAAQLGLPFAFASHFAPDQLMDALALYRSTFRPSASLATPYAAAAVQVVAAETDAAAARAFTSLQQSFVNLHRGRPGLLPRPVDSMDELWTPGERAGVDAAFREAIVGAGPTVQAGLAAFMQRTQVDELFITSMIHDHSARRRSFTLVADILQQRHP